jgi:hypothetical protein
MKTLFANGCSWTYGGGLDSPGTTERIKNLHGNIVWPAHLKRKMNFDQCINLSAGCGSNQRICRTTFDWLAKQDKETLENTTAVIQWTGVTRFEYYVSPTGGSDLQVEPGLMQDFHPNAINLAQLPIENLADEWKNPLTLDRWAKVNPHTLVSPFEDHNDEGVRSDAFSRYRTLTHQEGIYTWLTQLGFMHDLLNHYEIEHYFWQYAEYAAGYDQHIQDYIYTKFPFLEVAGSERKHSWKYERIEDIDPSSNDPHPSEQGHEEISEYLFDAIAKKKTILRRP